MATVLSKQPIHVADQAALLALPLSGLLTGDIVIVDDTPRAYMFIGSDPSILNSWSQITGGSGGGSGDADAVAADLLEHEADTTAVHGIANTALLETTAGAQAKADSAQTLATDAASDYADVVVGNRALASDLATTDSNVTANTTALTTKQPIDSIGLPVSTLPQPLKRFRQALAASDTVPLNWLALGDSLTEASGATKIDNGYIERVTRLLQRDYTAAQKGGFGYLSTFAKSSPSLNGVGSGINYWTFSGGGIGASGQTAFLGTRRYIPVANETATLSFVGTSFKLHHAQGPSTPTFTVSIDNLPAVTVTPATVTANRQGVYTSPALLSGQHTVLITPNTGTILPIDGATLFDGDETKGVRLINHATFGATSTSYLAGSGSLVSSQGLTDLFTQFSNPALVTIALGTNDPGNSIVAATTAANISTIIANVKTKCTITPSFVLIVPSRRAGVTEGTWNTYRDAIRGIAAADPTNVTCLDLVTHFIDEPLVGNSYLNGLVNTDGVHYTDAGYKLVGNLLGSFILQGVGVESRPVFTRPVGAGIYVPNDWGQRAWRPKLAANIANNAAARPVVAVVGDSISQGYNSSNPDTKSWPGLMRIALQSLGGDGGGGYWPASYADFAITAFATVTNFTTTWGAANVIHTTTGTWTKGTLGVGNCSLQTTVAGSTVTTRPMRGTTIEWYAVEGTPAATYTYAVDGGAPVTVTPGAPNVTVKRSVTGLSVGTHTIVFNFTGTGTFYWCGARGLNAAGIVVDNYSRYGSSSGNYIESYGLGWNGGSKQPADLVIVSLGVNDGGASTTGDAWAKNIRKYLDDVLNGTGQTGASDLIFVMQHVGTNDNTNSLYQDYTERARGMAEAFNAVFVDMWTLGRNSWNYFNTLGYWGNAASPGATGTDTVHLSDTGEAAVWNALAPIVTAVA